MGVFVPCDSIQNPGQDVLYGHSECTEMCSQVQTWFRDPRS